MTALVMVVLMTSPAAWTAPGGDVVELGFALQLRATHRGEPGASTPPSSLLEIRRLRFGLHGKAAGRRASFALQLGFTPAAPELLDAWVSWQPFTAATFRAGQFKLPLTRYRQQRFSELALVEWPLTAVYFGAERQVGLSARLDAAPHLHAELGLFSGQNARASFERGVATAWRIPPNNPSRLWRDSPSLPFHPELAGRLGWSRGPVGSRSVDTAGGALRWLVSVGGAWDSRPVPRREFRSRLVPELLAQWEGWALEGGLYLGWTDAPRAGEVLLASTGLHAELSRTFAPGLIGAARLSRVDLQPAFRSQLEAATGLRPGQASQEVILGVTVPLAAPAVQLQVDLSWLRDELDHWRTRVQLQLDL